LRLRRRSRAPISCYTQNARATAWEFLNNGITNASTGTGKRNQIFATAVCDNIVGQHLAFPRGVLGGRRLVSAMFIGNHGPGTTHAFERLSKCSAPLRLGKVFILHCLSQSARITWTEPGKCPAPLQPFDISFVVKATVGYQALDRHFQAAFHATLDFLLSAKQDAAAARRLLAKALGRQNHPVPRVINTDGHSAYPPAIVRLKVEGALDEDCWHRGNVRSLQALLRAFEYRNPYRIARLEREALGPRSLWPRIWARKMSSVGLVRGFEAVAADGDVGAAEVAWFPGLVCRAEGVSDVLWELQGWWWCGRPLG
jgi:DDE domain